MLRGWMLRGWMLRGWMLRGRVRIGGMLIVQRLIVRGALLTILASTYFSIFLRRCLNIVCGFFT
jgi:hypothetical protein